jgi:hypothetical protein
MAMCHPLLSTPDLSFICSSLNVSILLKIEYDVKGPSKAVMFRQIALTSVVANVFRSHRTKNVLQQPDLL